MFKIQLTANISVGKYFYDIMHFFFRMVWNKEMLYCHCFHLWCAICQYQSGMTEIVWGTSAFGLCWWYLFCLGRTKYHEEKPVIYWLQRALSHYTAMSWTVQVIKISGNDYEYSHSPKVGEIFCRSRTPINQP